MDPKDLFPSVIDQATRCIRQVDQSQLSYETPCSEWDLRALLNHMTYELLWVPDLLRGKTITEVGDRYEGDVLGSDFHASWQHAADSALVAVHQAMMTDTAHLSYADVEAGTYIAEIAGDILIHTWDVSQAIHCTLQLDQELVAAVYDNLLPRKEELRGSGLFGTPTEPPENATIQDKLLHLTGRKA